MISASIFVAPNEIFRSPYSKCMPKTSLILIGDQFSQPRTQLGSKTRGDFREPPLGQAKKTMKRYLMEESSQSFTRIHPSREDIGDVGIREWWI